MKENKHWVRIDVLVGIEAAIATTVKLCLEIRRPQNRDKKEVEVGANYNEAKSSANR